MHMREGSNLTQWSWSLSYFSINKTPETSFSTPPTSLKEFRTPVTKEAVVGRLIVLRSKNTVLKLVLLIICPFYSSAAFQINDVLFYFFVQILKLDCEVIRNPI